MAPEQLQGKPQPASDQYALGIVIYEWLSGERPFRGSFTEIASQHVLAPPPPLYGRVPGIVPDVEDVVFTTLNKDPQRRFRTMNAFINALEQAYRSAQSMPSIQTSMSTITMPQLDGSGVPTQVTSPVINQQPLQTPVIDASPVKPQPDRGGVSRRAVLLGIAGLAGIVAVGGGITGLALSRGFSFNNSTAVPPIHPTPLPAGIINIYHNHTLDVYAAAWSPDGKRVVSASQDKTVQVWDAATGNNIFVYRGHTANVWSVAWSHDGRRIASGGKDMTVQIWDSKSGDHVFTYTHHSATVWSAYWSPIAQLIASASSDKTVQVWQAS